MPVASTRARRSEVPWYGGRDPSRAPGHLPRRGAARGLRLLAAQRTHGAQWQSPFRWARRDLHKAPRIGVPAEGIDWRSGLVPPPHVAHTVSWPAGNRPSAGPPAAAARESLTPARGPGSERADASAPSGIDAAPPTTVTSTLHPPAAFQDSPLGAPRPGHDPPCALAVA